MVKEREWECGSGERGRKRAEPCRVFRDLQKTV